MSLKHEDPKIMPPHAATRSKTPQSVRLYGTSPSCCTEEACSATNDLSQGPRNMKRCGTGRTPICQRPCSASGESPKSCHLRYRARRSLSILDQLS